MHVFSSYNNGSIFFILGITIKYFKWYSLIAGYNTMNKEEKMNVDIEKIGRIIGNLFFVLAIVQIMLCILNYFNMVFLVILLNIASIFIVVISIMLLSQKYDKNQRNFSKTGIIAILIFFAIVMLLVYLLLAKINQPTKIIINDTNIKIEGIHGQTIPINSISRVTLQEEIPKILSKKNGCDLGSKLKGSFVLKDIGVAKLFIDKNKPPFIVIKQGNNYIILNFENRYETEAKFKQIYEKLTGK